MTKRRIAPNQRHPRPANQPPGTVPPMPKYEEMQERLGR